MTMAFQITSKPKQNKTKQNKTKQVSMRKQEQKQDHPMHRCSTLRDDVVFVVVRYVVLVAAK